MSYSFVPAAINWFHFSGLGAYIKYRHGPDEIRIREISTNHVWLQCPDRELLIVRDGHHSSAFRPLNENYDEYVSFDLFDPRVSAAFGLDFFMTNYIYTEKAMCPDVRVGGTPPGPGGTRIITDSGGFQVGQQKAAIIDPLKLVDHYNRNSDIGVVLDLPLHHAYGKELFMRAAKVQKKNTDIMMRNKRADLDLLNVFHGSTQEELNAFRNVVEREDIQRVAIGGSQELPLVAAIDVALDLITTGKKYDHYHLLGVYNVTHMLPLIRLANMKGFDRLITSDASTPLQSANNKIYHTQQAQDHSPRRLRLGDVATYPSTRNFFPCQCPVCATLKYVDILSVLDGAMYRHLLMLHNIWEIERFSKNMDVLARTLSHKEYREVARSQLINSQYRDLSLAALDFIHRVENDGIKAARTKHRAHLIRVNTLWQSSNETEAVLFTDDEREASLAAEKEDGLNLEDHRIYITRILEKYEAKDHIADTKPKRTKEERKKIEGRKRHQTAQRYSKRMKVGVQKKKPKKKLKKSQEAANVGQPVVHTVQDRKSNANKSTLIKITAP